MTDNGGYTTPTQTQTPPAPPPAPPATGTSAPPPGKPRGGGGGGAVAGVILILLGAALLFARLIPSFSIWQMWPFFVIVPGLIQCFTPGSEGWTVNRFFEGAITVAIGLVLLGNTTGTVSWGVWWHVFRLWPVLLISIGLEILGKAIRQNWIRVLSSVVILLALGVAVSASLTNQPVRLFSIAREGERFEFEERLDRDARATLDLESGVGEIAIGAADGRVAAIVVASAFGRPGFEVERSGSTAEIDFSLVEEGGFTISPTLPSTRVEASLARGIPWEITIDSGVSSLDADLSSLDVERFTLKTGVSSNTVRLGEPPRGAREAQAVIESGVASVEVLVPERAEVRVESDSGLTGIDISRDLNEVGSRVWETEGYATARSAGRPTWLIIARSGVGSFSVRTY